MAKKDKVQFQYSSDLDAVDAELAEAMEQLDQTNTRIDELLRAFDEPLLEAAKSESSGSASENEQVDSASSEETAS